MRATQADLVALRKRGFYLTNICSIVLDSMLFVRGLLERLTHPLVNQKRWVGWSVSQLIDRFAQLDVTVALENETFLALES